MINKKALILEVPFDVFLGCDIVAPSDMMDGRVARIARVLEQNGVRNKVHEGSSFYKFIHRFHHCIPHEYNFEYIWLNGTWVPPCFSYKSTFTRFRDFGML